MSELVPVRVSATPEQVTVAFVKAARAAQIIPTRELVLTLLAQSALETGHWRVMYCFNFGNVKVTDEWISDGGHYTFFPERPDGSPGVSDNLTFPQVRRAQAQSKDRTDGKPGPDMRVGRQRADGRFYCVFFPSHPQSRFRAFTMLDEGAHAYLAKLTGRYRAALGPASAFIYGDESWESTGVLSSRTVLTGIKTCQGRKSKHVIFWDEPDVGLSDSWAAGVGQSICGFVTDCPRNTVAALVVTHSKALVRELLPAAPAYVHLGKEPSEAPQSPVAGHACQVAL